jgi:hypothetical protein
MARVIKPLVTKRGRILTGTYFRDIEGALSGVTSLPTIPPERIGPSGDYDYYGLAKRVQASLQNQFGLDVTARLTIQQRGSAVLLSGKVTTWSIAEELAQFILTLEGATQVELHQLQVTEGQPVAMLSA